MNLINSRGQQRGASQEPWDRTLMWRGDTDPAASDLQFCAEISGHGIAGGLICTGGESCAQELGHGKTGETI